MKRLGLLVASVTLAGTALLVPGASPVSAHTCAGTGNATLSTGFGLPTTSNTASFSFSLTSGVCTPPMTASGTVSGACGFSTGSGTTNDGHQFSFQGVGTVLVITGEITGVVTATEDPTDAGSCTNKTATNFIVTGAVGSAVSTHSCTGTGNATLSTGFGLPTTFNTASFSFSLTRGVCALPMTASGTVSGACGLSTGSGATNDGRSFSFLSAGTVLVITGAVTGVATATEDPADAGSCTNKTATNFIVTGAVV